MFKPNMISVLFIICLFNTVQQRTFFKEKSLVKKALEEVLVNVFPKSRTVCFLYGHSMTEQDLLDTINALESTFITFSLSKLGGFQESLACSSTIALIEDFKELEEFLESGRNDSMILRPHSRLLVIVEKNQRVYNFDSGLIIDNAVDVLFAFIDRESLMVFSASRNETLLNWKSNMAVQVDQDKFKQPLWKPSFRKGNFTIVLFHCPPFVYYNSTVYGGTEFTFWMEVTKGWPIEYINGSDWYILKKKLLGEAYEMGVCSPWILVGSKSSAFEYTYPRQQICLTFLVPKSELIPPYLFLLISFKPVVWFAAIFTIIFISLLMQIIGYFYNEKEGKTETFSRRTIYWFLVIKLLSLGGMDTIPRGHLFPVRMVLITWAFGALIIANYYSAGLTTSLTFPRYTNPINTFQDMADQKLPWYVDDYFFNTYFKRSSVMKEANKYYQPGKRDSDGNSRKGIVVKLLQGTYVCDVLDLNDYVHKHYKILNQCYELVYRGFLFRGNSPYLKVFDRYYSRFIESGIYSYWESLVTKLNEGRQDSFFEGTKKEMRSLNVDMELIQGGFILLFVGYSLGFLVCVVEVAINKFK